MKKFLKSTALTLVLAAAALFGGTQRAAAQQAPKQKAPTQQQNQPIFSFPGITIVIGCPCETSVTPQQKKAINKAHSNTNKKPVVKKPTTKKTVKKPVKKHTAVTTPVKKSTTPVVTAAPKKDTATVVLTGIPATKAPVDTAKKTVDTTATKTVPVTPVVTTQTAIDTTAKSTPVAVDTSAKKPSTLDSLGKKITGGITKIVGKLPSDSIGKKVDLGLDKSLKGKRWYATASLGSLYTGHNSYTVTSTQTVAYPVQKPPGYTGTWSYPATMEQTVSKDKKFSSFTPTVGVEYRLSHTFYAAAAVGLGGTGKPAGYVALGAETKDTKFLGAGTEVGQAFGAGNSIGVKNMTNFTYLRFGSRDALFNLKAGMMNGMGAGNGYKAPPSVQLQGRLNLDKLFRGNGRHH